MLNIEQAFLPILTSKAGLTLTPANWEEVEIKNAVFYLDALLLKPGLDLLKKIEDFNTYIGWKGEIVFNASLCKANKEGIIMLTSPYDGSRIKLTYEALLELICHLKPKAVILPANILRDIPEFWQHWNKDIVPFFSLKDLDSVEHSSDLENQDFQGLYFNLDEFSSMSSLNEQIKKWSHMPQYFFGVSSFDYPNDLKQKNRWFESDEPASLALEGQVYNQEGILSLTNTQTAMQFELIDSNCKCPTCEQGFTQAYLHHLYFHTPLLAYRFLIQHNVYWSLKLN